ncbi:tetratricopeptide repeat-containing sulfotransferase family protein [Synechococcus sp. NOUM97013]|uniref:tetratricopeptide repeat-containing sulfotransferase family protein n=1 Tax=Synechococcus sp. NOUM97013 TaxID=1442555 RepID=UPI00164413E2|nr:tetratricopeptide repeat-containing sulfotransferase family protein [Synechococcus sp. NOUM97013]
MDQQTIKELSSTGRHQECLQACQQLLQSEPESLVPWKYAGKSLLALGQFEKAQQCLAKAHQIDNKDPEIVKDIGNIFNAVQNDAEAIRLYKEALSIDQNYAPAINNLGLIAKQQGNLVAAGQLVKRACDIDQSFAPYHMNLGGIYKDLGNLDQALASTLKSLELNPDNPDALINLGGIYKDLGNLDQALASTLKSLELNPDNPTAHMNLGGIYKNLGNLDQALASTLKSLELNPDNPDAHMNLGGIYKDLGNLDQALASTLKSLKLNPDNPDALINLSGIYKDLGNLDQALASTLKSLELKPRGSAALCKLGLIKMALAQTEEAKKYLFDSIACNTQECEAYFALSQIIETAKDAEGLIESTKQIKTSHLTPRTRTFIEFALSNCLHKLKKYDQAAKHLKAANYNKLTVFPSDASRLQQAIALSISRSDPTEKSAINTNYGKDRIFIIGMPRSGSTLLETILSMNPKIKDLGESRSLEKAIAKIQQQKGCKSDHQDLNEVYSQLEPINNTQHKYTTDKQLYNFIYINWITAHMPSAKIIHCRRNPMDNILSMYRSNLTTGNNYTANLEDSAKVLVAQEKAIQINKKRYPEKIFTFDYDQFVNAPEDNLRKLLRWLDLDFDDNYLHPEKSTRSVNTASVIQARKPIRNKSVGGWKNYETLLKPALKLIQESGVKID